MILLNETRLQNRPFFLYSNCNYDECGENCEMLKIARVARVESR